MIQSTQLSKDKISRDKNGRPVKKIYVRSKGMKAVKIVKLTCITKDIRNALMEHSQYDNANFGTGGRPSRILTTISYILAKNDRLALVEALNTTKCRGYTLSNRMLRFTLTREYTIAVKFDAKKRIVRVYKDNILVFHEPVAEEYVKTVIRQFRAVNPLPVI